MYEIAIEQAEEDILACEIPDEVLESAVITKSTAAYTLGSCTSVIACPGG